MRDFKEISVCSSSSTPIRKPAAPIKNYPFYSQKDSTMWCMYANETNDSALHDATTKRLLLMPIMQFLTVDFKLIE